MKSSNSSTNVKHIHGDVNTNNTQESLSPLDDASCCASDLPSERALKAVELVNKMRSKYQEAEQYPKESEEYMRLFNEGKEYLKQLEHLNS